ncbi:MAG: hypothetical protein ABGX23_05510 [Nautiliaceae bacterium]
MKKIALMVALVSFSMAMKCESVAIQVGKKGVVVINKKTKPMIEKAIGPLLHMKLEQNKKSVEVYFDNNITAKFNYLDTQKNFKRFVTKDGVLLVNDKNESEVILVLSVKDKNTTTMLGIFYNCK